MGLGIGMAFRISVSVQEDDFEKIIEIWDLIEEAAEKRILQLKQQKEGEADHLDWINENLVIEVDTLRNV